MTKMTCKAWGQAPTVAHGLRMGGAAKWKSEQAAYAEEAEIRQAILDDVERLDKEEEQQ